MRILLIAIFPTLFLMCKNTNSTETPKDQEKDQDSLVLTSPQALSRDLSSDTNIHGQSLYVLVDKLRLREQPGSKSKVLLQLSEGTLVTSLGQTSDFTDRVQLREKWITAPWIKVKTDKGTEGWIFAGAVASELPNNYISRTPYDECAAAYVRDRNFDNYYKCVDQKAEEAYQKNRRYINQHKNGYTITLLGGDEVNLENDLNPENEENFKRYRYLWHLDKMGYFVFELSNYENTDYLLMDDKYGYVTMLYGLPRMSPDRQSLLVVSFETVDSDHHHAISIMTRTQKGFETVYSRMIEEYKPINPRWESDKKISLDMLPPEFSTADWTTTATLAKSETGRWELLVEPIE